MGSQTYPGVYFRTIDDSAYTLGLPNDSKIGLVCDTLKGPALQWVRVSNWGEFQQIFGPLPTSVNFQQNASHTNPTPYGPMAARTLLSEIDELYVYRLLKDADGAMDSAAATKARTADLSADGISGIAFELLSSGGLDIGDWYESYSPSNRPVYFVEVSNVNKAEHLTPRKYDIYVYESDQYAVTVPSAALSGVTFNGYALSSADASNLKAKEVFKNVVFLADPTSGISVLDAIGADGRGQVSSLIKAVITSPGNWSVFNSTGTGALGSENQGGIGAWGSIWVRHGDVPTTTVRNNFVGGDGRHFGTGTAMNLVSLPTDASNIAGLETGLDILLMPDAHLCSAAANVATGQDSLIDLAESYTAIAVVSPVNTNTVGTLKDWAIARNSSFGAGYAPWLSVWTGEDGYSYQPPDAWVAKAYLYTDRVNWPWFAPAGAKRGALGDVTPRYTFTEANQEILYDAGVNVIRNIAAYGPVVWGQKTLQQQNTALDRVNVRRLVNYIQHRVEEYGANFLFEPNDATTWSKFSAIVISMMENIKAENGVYDYRVIIDETTNTPTVIDQNKLAGKIFLKPTKTAEVITVDFIISGTGASFE